MKANNDFAEFRRMQRILPLVAALALAGSPRAWGQCISGEAPPPTSTSVTLSPTTMSSGVPTTLTATITLNSEAGFANGALGLDMQFVMFPNFPWMGDVWIPCKDNHATVTLPNVVLTVTQAETLTFKAWGAGTPGLAYLVVLPAGQPANPANLGPVGPNRCVLGCAHPINLADGNVWIQQRDYSVPGLGGGLELSRTWNSRWGFATPPSLAGMFGNSWRSTYEEQLAPAGPGTLQYWRADGSAWTFTYNNILNTFSLTSPPDERTQLVQNPATGLFTITFADGTQRAFNANNQLAALIDRNGNQTTLSYDNLNRLTTVTSPGGSTLSFTYADPYNSLQATQAQDAVGTVTARYPAIYLKTNGLI